MTVSTPARRHSASEQVEAVGRYGWLGLALVALGVGLIVNSLLGPLVLDAIDYPVSESLLNQTIGLEAVSLFLVAPLCVLAGVLALRGHAAAPVVALGPALYTAYMFLQYVIGPEYDYYPGVLPLHLALFILGAGIALAAWAAVDRTRLPQMTRRSQRRYAVVLLLLAAFVMARYLPVFIAGLSGDPLSAEYRSDVSMYWSIVLLDLGLVVPGTIAAAAALLRGATWAGTALYAVLGWFALVPPSVAAMAVVMVLNDDPHASTGQAVLLTVAAAVFAALMVRLYRPLFARRARDETRDEAGRGGEGAGPSAPAEGGHDVDRTRPGA